MHDSHSGAVTSWKYNFVEANRAAAPCEAMQGASSHQLLRRRQVEPESEKGER
jgi:hypothetical protein